MASGADSLFVSKVCNGLKEDLLFHSPEVEFSQAVLHLPSRRSNVTKGVVLCE